MKNNRVLSTLLSCAFALLAFATASAQEQLASFNGRGSSQPVMVMRPSVMRLESLKAEMTSLQKRKVTLRRYLSSGDPASADYKATQRLLVELEVKLQDMARDIVRLATTVGAQPVEPVPVRRTRAAAPADLPALPAAAVPAAPQTDTITAGEVASEPGTAKISVDISKFFGDDIRVESKSDGKLLSSEEYHLPGSLRRTGTFTVEVKIAATGNTVVTVSSLDGTVTTDVTVAAPAPTAAPAVTGPTSKPPSRLVGLLLGGTVISQQAENLSQADPFMGFIVGYDDIPSDPFDPGWRLHWRVQSIFQVQPKMEEAPVEGTGDGEDADDDGTADPADFRSFIASRKSFDVEMSFWFDRPAKKFLFFGGGCKGIKDLLEKEKCEKRPHVDPNFRIGPYFAVGGTAYVSKNELKGDESVKVEDTKDANNNDSTNDQVELDVERAKVDNDIDLFYEGGLIGNFTKGAQDGQTKLFMQVKLGYGRYESLAGFNPGKTGFFNDSRNRFVGKLRIFPMFLDRDPEGTADASPMFGVEINAGRGPDQIKFFTGIATAFKLLKK
jgi:hypothetical protein